MKPENKGLSIYLKLFIVFVLFAILVSADYYIFSSKLRKTDLYDELNNHFASIGTSIIRLEYTLDMFVVARRFEDTTVSLIKRDVNRLDTSIQRAVNNFRYAALAYENSMLMEGFVSISNDWSRIKNEVASLNEAMTQEEVLLIHNEVDVNTILVNETADRLIGVVSAAKKQLRWELRVQSFLNIAAFFIFWVIAYFVVYRRLIRPIKMTAEVVDSISSGDLGARFDEGSGTFTRPLKGSLNRMLDAVAEHELARGELLKDAKARLLESVGQVEALGLITAFAGTSLSRADIFIASLKEAVDRGGADAAAVYMTDDGVLRLKASEGFGEEVTKEGAVISGETVKGAASGTGAGVFTDLDQHPDQGYARLLKSSGFNAMVSVPIRYGNGADGVLCAAFKDPGAINPTTPAFIKAVGTNIGVFSGYIDLFHNEYSVKRFLERVFNQLPFGIAVFDRSGTCMLLNNHLRKLLGAHSDDTLVGEYRIVEDDVFKDQGVISSIKKAYEGYMTEFIINYNPALITRHRFKGTQKRLKIRSIPLYDDGGEISNIVLLYEDLSDSAEPEEKGDDAI
jgi:PAS domain-containing protein